LKICATSGRLRIRHRTYDREHLAFGWHYQASQARCARGSCAPPQRCRARGPGGRRDACPALRDRSEQSASAPHSPMDLPDLRHGDL
jgi:hypothetical protein